MNENKEIEEMARVLIKASCKGRECENCLFIDNVKEAEECCGCLKALYNAGYRNAKDKVVLSKEVPGVDAYIRLQSSFESFLVDFID